MHTLGPTHRDHSAEAGFSLVEVMVATMILVIGLLGVVVAVDAANRTTRNTRAREAGTSLARQVAEAARAIPFQTLSTAGVASDLQAQPGLAKEPTGSGYAIERRGFRFSIDVSVCSLDDPRDGIGSHAGGSFCTGGATALGNGSNCSAAVGGAPSGNLDANGNRFDSSLCASVGGTIVWSACDLLNTTGATQSSGAISGLLGSQLAAAQAAASATSCSHGSPVAADVDPEDYKRVTVQARWHKQKVQQTALIANPGTAGGPAITALTLNGQPSTTITSNPSSLAFSATPSIPPATVSWTLDADQQGIASGSGTTPWNFTWTIGSAGSAGSVLDGTYLIGARAEDQYGVAGPGRDLSITLNRSLPFAPTGVAGGRARGGVDIEWQANRERDIIGYTVYRQVPLGAVVTVCAQITVTNCHDAAPPPDALVDYWVVALDRDSSGASRAGAASEVQHVRLIDVPPTAPPTLSASSSNGTTVLTWTPGVDPDPGDSVDFYRIYRDGSAVTDRYDRTGLGSDLTWTDTATGGEAHTYYVSAVDTQLGESPLTGPVTR